MTRLLRFPLIWHRGIVMAGLVPALPIQEARHCQRNRDHRDKPGDDSTRNFDSNPASGRSWPLLAALLTFLAINAGPVAAQDAMPAGFLYLRDIEPGIVQD